MLGIIGLYLIQNEKCKDETWSRSAIYSLLSVLPELSRSVGPIVLFGGGTPNRDIIHIQIKHGVALHLHHLAPTNQCIYVQEMH